MPSDFERRLRELRAGFPLPDETASDDARESVVAASRSPRRPRKARLVVGLVMALLFASAVGFSVGRWAVPSRGAAAASISIAARPQTAVAWTQLIALYGAVGTGQAGETVTVEAKECGIPGDRFHLVAETRTSAGGAWIADQDGTNVGATTQFRARWRNSVSDTITVFARPGMQLTRAGSIYTLSVRGDDFFAGRIAVVERFDEHRHWLRVKRIVLKRWPSPASGPGGIARFRTSVRHGTLVRVVLPAAQVKPCFLAGFSNSVKA